MEILRNTRKRRAQTTNTLKRYAILRDSSTLFGWEQALQAPVVCAVVTPRPCSRGRYDHLSAKVPAGSLIAPQGGSAAGIYNPAEFAHLNVPPEVQEVFQLIGTQQHLRLHVLHGALLTSPHGQRLILHAHGQKPSPSTHRPIQARTAAN